MVGFSSGHSGSGTCDGFRNLDELSTACSVVGITFIIEFEL